jgi:hypothetical protein
VRISCETILLATTGAEDKGVNPLKVIRHQVATAAYTLLDGVFAVYLYEICEEFVELC